MTSIELLKEIESWLSFNTEPSKEETAKLRKSIKNHLTEQLRIHDVVGQSEQLPCPKCGDYGTIDNQDGTVSHLPLPLLARQLPTAVRRYI
jgi:hypothetical protein